MIRVMNNCVLSLGTGSYGAPALPRARQQCILSVCLSYSLGLHTDVKGIPEIEIDTKLEKQPLIVTGFDNLSVEFSPTSKSTFVEVFRNTFQVKL